MAQPKTRRNKADVFAFLAGVENSTRREDCRVVVRIMEEITGEPPTMWGGSIIGFGSYRYKYASGREGDWFLTGVSPRKQNLTVYIMPGFSEYDDLMANLGKHKTGKSCLYINKLDDVHLPTLKKLIRLSAARIAKRYEQMD